MATKPISLAPLTGVLDLRSSPDLIPVGGVRYRLNLQTVAEGKLRRGTGWTKLLTTSNYNNTDFHDQLLTFGDGHRCPVTLLHQAQSTYGTRSLFVATQERIARLNEYSGNYKILGSGFGGTAKTSVSAPRFKAAQVGDYLWFTNDFDRPTYHILEQVGLEGESLYEAEDLETIGLRRAKLVWAWHNTIFFANVEMDGQRFAYRIVWSDFDNPTSFDPAKADSITGSKDLFANEEILAGEPCGSSFLIYTTHGIWEMVVVGGEESFAFRRAYNADKNELKAVLSYPNALVNMGNTHLYMAQEQEGVGIYQFTVGMTEPERPEWLHRASALFDNIDQSHCEVHVGGIHGDEILFSVAETGQTNELPNITLRINHKYKTCDIVDAGFTAFANYNSYRVATVRDFMIENEICTLDGINELGYGFVNEGLPRPLPEGTLEFTPTSIFTNQSYAVYDVYYGTYSIYAEDWTYPYADPYSLCTLLSDLSPDDICKTCKGQTVFVGAASADLCLKQLGGVFYRETCLNPTAVGSTTDDGYSSSVGSYVLSPYSSIFRFAPVFTDRGYVVQCDSFEMDYLAVAQSPPSEIGLRVGISAQVGDPNTDNCGIVWHQHSLQKLRCITQRTAAQHLAKNTQPAETLGWNFIRKGKILYFELRLDGTGGDCEFSRVHSEFSREEARNF